MSIATARRFIQRALVDEAFVIALNDASAHAEVQALLNQEGFQFNEGQFEDAYHNLLIQCQHAEQAEGLREIKLWWDFLVGYFAQQQRLQDGVAS